MADTEKITQPSPGRMSLEQIQTTPILQAEFLPEQIPISILLQRVATSIKKILMMMKKL